MQTLLLINTFRDDSETDISYTEKKACILFLTTGQVFEHVILAIDLDFENQNY